MIPKECKRLAEVDFPTAAVSNHAVREKEARRPDHPSTLHTWWARRPLASSRAILLALLLPDPCDPKCPAAFKEAASTLLPTVGCGQGKTDEKMRLGLLKFIADFANWDNSVKKAYLDVGRSFVRAAHGKEPPLVVDPFAGGGSIPLEALRLGCETFASDLNPIACMILKTMLEDIPRHGPELTEKLQEAGNDIKQQVEQELVGVYPADSDKSTPIAYLWARTVRCEAPYCGAEIPLMRSFWLCNTATRKKALRHSVERAKGTPPQAVFSIFEPTTDKDVHTGTVTRAKASCLCCGSVLTPERVRAQLIAEHGGADVIFDDSGRRIGGARITAVVTLRPGKKGRHYRLPVDSDYVGVREAQERIARMLDNWKRGDRQGLCPIPNEPLPPIGTLGFRIQRYGMLQWGNLFTARQKLALVELGIAISRKRDINHNVYDILTNCIGKRASFSSSGTRWYSKGQNPINAFGIQAIPMTWDFVETTPLGDTSGSFGAGFASVYAVSNKIKQSAHRSGQVQLADATAHPLPDQVANVWFTDPPYYDAVPYSDLSDFFLVWLKRCHPDHPFLRDPFDSKNPLSPKEREAVQDKTKKSGGRTKDRSWFEETMAKAFAEGHRVLAETGIGSVVFAHKTTEGWEALLQGMIRGGWTITASWPIATESPKRLRSRDSAALATSIHLICRPRPENAPIGEWADVLQELPPRVTGWMKRLQEEGVRGADLVFACIGPALEIFSRYSLVETAEGQKITLPEYLEKVWEVVGRAALKQVLSTAEVSAQNGMAGALEEDARLTALFLWAIQSTENLQESGENGAAPAVRKSQSEPNEKTEEPVAKGFNLPFDVVRRFSQPMGIDLDRWTGRIIAQEKGVVRLLTIAERGKILFGDNDSTNTADWIETSTNSSAQQTLFPDVDTPPTTLPGKRSTRNELDADSPLHSPDATVLDRVHIAMLLQASGYANALRRLVSAEQERGPDFLRLANALSALYPRGSREKRVLDAMLLTVPK